MNVPEELGYTSDHEWARVDGSVVRVGITDYAQEALGDVVFVQPPDVGRMITEGESIGEIESTKSVSDIYSPVAGTVLAVNAELADHPELVNQEPYGAGWICDVEIDPGAPRSLLSPSAYRDLVAGGGS